MVGAVEGGADEVVHAGIHDEERLRLTAFHEEHTRDQRTALRHHRAARLNAHTLLRPAPQFSVNDTEPFLEIRHRVLIRLIIIHTKTAAEVDAAHFHPVRLEPFHNLRSPLALKRIHRLHVSNLRADMKMQTFEIQCFATLQNIYRRLELVAGDTELVLIQACGHVPVRVRVNVGIYTQGNIGPNPFRGSEGVDHLHFHQRLDIETADSQIERV